jgi:hypothetical protein
MCSSPSTAASSQESDDHFFQTPDANFILTGDRDNTIINSSCHLEEKVDNLATDG